MRSRYMRAALGALLSLAPVGARAEWIEASTPNFRIVGDGEATNLRDFAIRLERFDRALRQLRGLGPAPAMTSNRLTIYAVAEVKSLEKVCGAACTDTLGFYVASAGGSAIYTPIKAGKGRIGDVSPDLVLFHEYTHHFMYRNYPAAFPMWFSEGFAEFNATARIDPDNSVVIGAPAVHRAEQIGTLPLHAIPQMLARSPYSAGAWGQTIYAGGWLLTHYLTFEPSRKGQLDGYLRGYARGEMGMEAARGAFGDLSTLEAAMKAYVRKPFKVWRIRAEGAEPAVTLRTLSAGEAATMPVKMRTDSFVQRHFFPAIAGEARRLAAPFPKDAAAQTVLADAEFDAGQLAAADAAADRAIAADPTNVAALLAKGRIRLRIAARAGTREAATWKEARSWLLKANRIDPDQAEVLMRFYDSYALAGEPPNANALAALRQAFALAPEDRSLRWRIVVEDLRAGDVASARTNLQPLALQVHFSSNDSSAALIDALEKGRSPATLLKDAQRAAAEAIASQNSAD